ncbi:hypothetical protein [Pseudomonas faucium]|uniref:hypothetical protein n=1 Tax=Pseudomonas faucium TaxID=2740518 RepID=UPI0039C3CD29
MRRSLTATLVALSVSSMALADAGTPLSTWSALTTRTPKGTPLCALTATPASGLTMKNVVVKKFGGSEHLNLTMYKDSWRIPQGTSVITTIDFSDGQPLTLESYGDGKIVDAALPKEVTATFLSMMSRAKVLRISFPNGKEPAWSASLVPGRSEMKAFVECMLKQENTQPF